MIDPKAARRALIETDASVRSAAKKLGVPAADLRRLIRSDPELMAVALERTERKLDKAEQIIRDGMESADPLKRLEAAALFLRGRFRRL
jgi:hypothetical protein